MADGNAIALASIGASEDGGSDGAAHSTVAIGTTAGPQSVTVEAAAVNVETDQVVYFATPPANRGISA